MALFTDARTANTFASTPVTDAELTEIWELAKWAPTAANTQPLRVLFIRSLRVLFIRPLRVLFIRPEARDRLITHMNDGNKVKTSQAPRWPSSRSTPSFTSTFQP